MEKAKPSKKKAYYKNQQRNTETNINKNIDWRKVGKKSTGRLNGQPNEETNADVETLDAQEKYFSKRPVKQPKSRLLDVDEIWQETNVGQNFETLLNAPMSSGSFVFKSEKNWTLDATKYDEYFSLDMKNLATIINCIPYNQLIDVDDKYFTTDELTYINSSAEQARKAYEHTLKSLTKENNASDRAGELLVAEEKDSRSEADESSPSARLADELNPESRTAEEDLDFLLSLKEPVIPQPVAVSVAAPAKIGSDDLKQKNTPAVTKSIDLEKWLDSVLDD